MTSHYHDLVSTGIQTYVRTLRESQRIARKALADVMGVSIAAYADWEAGRGNDMALPTLIRAITHSVGHLRISTRLQWRPMAMRRLGAVSPTSASPRRKCTGEP